MTENQHEQAEINRIIEIPVNQVIPNKQQPRKEFKEAELTALVQSIKENGQLYPICVSPIEDGKYEIIDGERRWRAIEKLSNEEGQERTIKVIHIEKPDAIQGVIANILREDYNPMERAESCKLLKLHLGEKATDDDVARMIGKGRSTVTELLSLFKLPDIVQKKANENSCVPFGKLKRLAAQKNSDDDKIIEYDRLHDKYLVMNQAQVAGEVENTTEKISMSRGQRKVQSVTKKLLNVSSYFDKIDIEQADNATKQELVRALNETINCVQGYLDKISGKE